MRDMKNPGALAGATGADGDQSDMSCSATSTQQQILGLVRLVIRNLYDPARGARPDLWRVELEDGEVLLEKVRLPLLDGARALLARGHDPATPITMRKAGCDYDCFVGVRVGMAARLTVEEGARSAHFRRHRDDVAEKVRGGAVLSAFEVGNDADRPEYEIAAHGAEAAP